MTYIAIVTYEIREHGLKILLGLALFVALLLLV